MHSPQLNLILQKLAGSGADCVVAGDFANSLWTGRYAGHDARYQIHKPFTSQELDLIGDWEEAILIGRALSVIPTPNANPAGAKLLVPFPRSQRRLRINILVGDKGVDYAEAFASAQAFEFAEEGFSLTVLDPFLCLQNKAFALLVQEQASRNDERHARFAVLNVEHRIKELLESDLPWAERDVLKLTERTFRLALSKEGLRIAVEHGINLETAIPTALLTEKCGTLAKFALDRLPVLQRKLAAKRSAGLTTVPADGL
jgi:hypothetical protein